MHHQQQEYYHHQNSGVAGSCGRDLGSALFTPPPQSQCASIQPSPASASSAVTTASGGDAGSFGAMYSSPSTLQAPVLARYDGAAPALQQHAPFSLAEFSTAPAPPAGAANSWTGGGMALDDMFLPELLGVGDFPPGDLFGGGFMPLLQDRASSLQELSACYLPNAQAEMWAAADHVKPPAGLCHSLT
uniref:Uncharacterized protein n=1 Tax=Arundo donax TaxID=35708 RepID=A0A0A9FE03_ARUDO